MRLWWKDWRQTVKARWSSAMPKFFKVIFKVFAFIGGMALAINTAMVSCGAVPHQWWVDIYPYLIGVSAGAMFVSKMTAKDRKDIPGFENECKREGNTILDHDNF